MTTQQIPEPDWHLLTSLKSVALDKLCNRILKKAITIAGDKTKGSPHERYLRLYRHINNSDKDLASSFDNWRRSDALFILANWRRERLISDEEFSTFSEFTQNSVNLILSL